LGEARARRGIRARGPALPGHNETPQRLARVPHTAWLDAARSHLHELRTAGEPVFVVGLSMGGLLALDLAAAEPVDGVIAIGTPLRLHHPLAWLIPLFKHVSPMRPKPEGSDICDAAARERHPSYDVMPLPALHELMRLQRRVRRRLARVTAPILVAHGAHDRTARPADARTSCRWITTDRAWAKSPGSSSSASSRSLVVPVRAKPGPPRSARLRLAARALRALALPQSRRREECGLDRGESGSL
jgi:esterase/lipase